MGNFCIPLISGLLQDAQLHPCLFLTQEPPLRSADHATQEHLALNMVCKAAILREARCALIISPSPQSVSPTFLAACCCSPAHKLPVPSRASALWATYILVNHPAEKHEKERLYLAEVCAWSCDLPNADDCDAMKYLFDQN